uniref:ATP-dependent DNA helicase n=1 Tax=Globisporangium ultimum (strain ATCC 200006 / CBS 805.95 / DAOM BR144) TaxID=431595 RepID=K3W551_GLOUD
MSAAAVAVHCELEFQVANAHTGRNMCTTACKRTVIIKRRGGLEVVSENPPMRKALKMQEQKYEVYSSHVNHGKLTFITRDGPRMYQYNFRGGEPAEIESIFAFTIRMGAISKTPRARVPTTSALQQPPTYSSLLRKRQAERAPEPEYHTPRRALRDVSNEIGSPESSRTRRIGATQYERTRKTRRVLAHNKQPSVQQQQQDRQLTREQQQIMTMIAQKRNVFFTGSAGTGKSFLLQHILKKGLQKTNGRVYATATTGIAAYNIGGMTLHHFAGLDTRPNAKRDDLLRQIQQKKDALMRWRDVEMLVIDEISMLDGGLFDDLEALARHIRRDNRFFGGIQLVLSGDFFQLPPVSRDRNSVTLCFESAAWRKGIDHIMVLKEVFRQTNQEFVRILDAFRVGKPTNDMIATLNKRYTPTDDQSDWTAIHIFTHNNDVLQTINPASGLVNGSRGIIQGFTPQTNLPIVRFSNGSTEIIQHEEFTVRVADTVLAARRQLPLTLAWAISIHKSQGLSFDSAVLDLSRVFEYGQAYVALSRVRSLEGLRLRSRLRNTSSSKDLVLANARVLRFYQQIDDGADE